MILVLLTQLNEEDRWFRAHYKTSSTVTMKNGQHQQSINWPKITVVSPPTKITYELGTHHDPCYKTKPRTASMTLHREDTEQGSSHIFLTTSTTTIDFYWLL